MCEDIMGDAVGAKGMGPAVGVEDTGSGEASGVGDKDCSSWGFLGQCGQVAEVRMFSTGTSSSS